MSSYPYLILSTGVLKFRYATMTCLPVHVQAYLDWGFKYVLKFMTLQASLNLSFVWDLWRFDKLIHEGFSFLAHFRQKCHWIFSNKWNDIMILTNFSYVSHSLSLPPDFHILCKMGIYLRFLCGAVLYFVFHCDIGMPSVSFSVHQVSIHRNKVIVLNLFCAAQVIKCYFAITGKLNLSTLLCLISIPLC